MVQRGNKYLITRVGYKHWEEQKEMTEIASLNKEEQVDIMHRNTWELSRAYWTVYRTFNSICVPFVKSKIVISVIFLSSAQILHLTLVTKYMYPLSGARFIGIVDGSYWQDVNIVQAIAWVHQVTSHYLNQYWQNTWLHMMSLGHNKLMLIVA